MLQLLMNQTEQLYGEQPENTAKLRANLSKAQDIVQQTILRMDGLYKSFKNTQLELQLVDVNEFMLATLNGIQTPKHIQLKLSLLPENGAVLADPYHLRECLLNLILNAFEAIPTEICGEVSLSLHSEYSWVICEIRDNGCGIEKKLLHKIFDPFYTQKNTARNWGVGLSYSKQVINGHMGHIDVQSTLGKGSSFCIFIPLSDQSNTIERSLA